MVVGYSKQVLFHYRGCKKGKILERYFVQFEKTFLSLFSITSNKDSLGSECVGAGWEGGGGNLPFSRWFNDWELVDIYLFPL